MLNLNDIINAPLEELFNEVVRERTENVCNDIELCAIVNIKSGRCSMNCRFCAQSQHYETSAETSPILSAEQLSVKTHQLWDQGILRVGWVASGCTPAKQELDSVIEAAEILFADKSTKQICASLGQLETPALQRLQTAGFSRYHHNLETSSLFYPAICTTQRWNDRWATVARAKDLGLQVCSGGLFGLGETWEDRRDLADVLRHLEVDSMPINFFNPIAGTPLADRKPLSVEEALRIVILFRLRLPTAVIRICGGRPTVFADRGQDQLLFRAGADALMTGNYLTTSGISPETDRHLIDVIKRERCR